MKSYSIILILGLGIIVYSNSFLCSFHFDDKVFITDNPVIRNMQDLHQIWVSYPCRFLTFLSFALNYHFNGLDVFGYHLFNLLVHIISALLVWWLTLLTLSTPAMKENKIVQHANLIGLFSGLVFVSHPIQTEAVTYIWQRAASMSAMFYLASLCFYVKSRLMQHNESVSGPWRDYYICALIMAIMAMFTKEITITLPLMVLFYEFTFFNTKGKLSWSNIVPFLFTLLIIPLTMFLTSSVNTFSSQAMQHWIQGSGDISSLHYLLTQLRVMVTYIRLVFLPLNLNLDYDYPVFKSFFEWPVLTGFLFIGSVLFIAQRLFIKYRLVSFSIFWFFLTLLPESSFWPSSDIMFEHRLYLPMAGYSIFLVSGLYYLSGKNSVKIIVLALSVIIALYSFLTFQRNKVWRDDITLWSDVAKKSPHKSRAYLNLGSSYFDQGKLDLSLADFNKAIDLDPNNYYAYNDRGMIYRKQGKPVKAVIEFTKAVMAAPQYIGAYYNRGTIFKEMGNTSYAIADFTKITTIDPYYADAYTELGNIYYQLKEYDKARIDEQIASKLGR